MTLYEFNNLDLSQRADRCWNHGRFIRERVTETRRSLFFSHEDYFVEIALSIAGNDVAEIIPFKEGTRYDRMVESMKTPDLS